MKRLASMALGIVLVSIQPALAHTRHVDGTILLPSLKLQSGSQPVDRPARCAWLSAGASSQGVLGWIVTLSDEDELHTFSLSGPRDPDVTFYSHLGACDGMNDAVPLRIFSGPASEAGSIPLGARYAVITVSVSSVTIPFVFSIY